MDVTSRMYLYELHTVRDDAHTFKLPINNGLEFNIPLWASSRAVPCPKSANKLAAQAAMIQVEG